MSYLGFGYDATNNKFNIVQDTLATDFNFNPIYCVEKSIYHESSHTIISGVGDVMTLSILNVELLKDQPETYEEVMFIIEDFLPFLRKQLKVLHYDQLSSLSLYVFGFIDGLPHVTKIYIEDKAETIDSVEDYTDIVLSGKLVIKPEYSLSSIQTSNFVANHKISFDVIDSIKFKNEVVSLTEELTVYALEAHLGECSKPKIKGKYIGIGGTIYSYELSSSKFKRTKILDYPENKLHNINTHLKTMQDIVTKK